MEKTAAPKPQLSPKLQLSTVIFAWGALSIASTVGVAMAPALLVHAPIALLGLSPLGRHLVMTASAVPLGWFVAVVAVRRTCSAILGYFLWRAHGAPILVWAHGRSARLGSLLGALERGFVRAGPLLMIAAPGSVFAFLAGKARWRLGQVVSLLLLGHALWALGTYYLGLSLAPYVAPITVLAQKYMLEATLVCIPLSVFLHFLRKKTRKKGLLPWGDVEP